MEIQLDQQETKNPDRIRGEDRLCWPTKEELVESTAQRFSSSFGNQQLQTQPAIADK